MTLNQRIVSNKILSNKICLFRLPTQGFLLVPFLLFILRHPPKLMSTDHQKKKLTRIFKMMQTTEEGKKNGQVLKRDFVHWGELFAEASKVEFTDELKSHWEKACSIYFSNGAGDSAEKWIKSVEEFGKTPSVIQICTELNMAMFMCADANKDGVVSFDEFKDWVSVLGVTDQDDVKFAFKMIDENKDGVLSQEELGKACAHYYMDAEDTPYKHFYGKFEG
jgi:RNase P subunit RPR2